jgi:hypothetical protein
VFRVSGLTAIDMEGPSRFATQNDTGAGGKMVLAERMIHFGVFAESSEFSNLRVPTILASLEV